MSKHKHRKHSKMSTLDELEKLYTSVDAPINPSSIYKKPSKPGKGYEFYSRVKENLAEWWEEFNGSLDRYGRLKYETIKQFVKSKTSSGSERRFLYQMIGPAMKEIEVPWLGDWEKRRRAGFGVLDNPDKIRPLIKVIQNNLAAVESIKSLTPVLVEELVQYSALQKQVHEAFSGKAFLSGKAADDKRSVGRFKVYKAMLSALTELKINIVHEIMRVHGVNPELPEQMRDMAQIAGGIGAAAALTGVAATQAGRIGGVLSSDGTTIAPYTYDSIKLAEHLTRHAHVFKRPLPPIIEGEEVEEVEHEESSSRKANGHGRPQ